MLQHALVNEPTSTPLLTCQGAVACDQGPLDPEFGPDPVPYEDIDCVGIQRGDWVRELAAHGEEAFVPLSERIDDAACPIAGIRLSGGGGGGGWIRSLFYLESTQIPASIECSFSISVCDAA